MISVSCKKVVAQSVHGVIVVVPVSVFLLHPFYDQPYSNSSTEVIVSVCGCMYACVSRW